LGTTLRPEAVKTENVLDWVFRAILNGLPPLSSVTMFLVRAAGLRLRFDEGLFATLRAMIVSRKQ
tara:strand:- start:389 stop:583 length:195 start_codon:yes stop_codon:yes gene_type:complete